jgi:hypothetical protein
MSRPGHLLARTSPSTTPSTSTEQGGYAGNMLGLGDAVAYVGAEDATQRIYVGHPGRVVDVGLLPHEIAVSFVSGTSCGLEPGVVIAISEAEYVVRGQRLVEGLHPLEDRHVPKYQAAGFEWPDGPGVSARQ